MAEFLQCFTVPPSSSVTAGVPKGGIAGVYASGAITMAWEDNAFIGDLITGVIWEPSHGFHPRPTSKLVFTNNGATAVSVSVRCFEE